MKQNIAFILMQILCVYNSAYSADKKNPDTPVTSPSRRRSATVSSPFPPAPAQPKTPQQPDGNSPTQVLKNLQLGHPQPPRRPEKPNFE